jgi:predicted transcriptional regulator
MTTWDKIKLGCLILLLCLIACGVSWLYFHKEKSVATPVPSVVVQPQVVHTNTETVREIAVETAPKGNLLQFTERDGKQYLVIDGKEYQLASKTGPAQIKIGENGQIIMSTETTSKIDVTDMVKAQVNDKLAIQFAELKKKYEKNYTLGGEITNKDISADLTYKGKGLVFGYSYEKKDLRTGIRGEWKF